MKRTFLVFIIIVAGCAAAEHPVSTVATDEPERDSEGYSERVEELWAELERVAPERGIMQMSPSDYGAKETPENCRAAVDIRDRICDLSRRICAIAEREPSSIDTATQCRRATDGCESARERVSLGCDGVL